MDLNVDVICHDTGEVLKEGVLLANAHLYIAKRGGKIVKDEVEVLKVCEDLIVEKMKNQNTVKINTLDSVINIYQTGQVHAQIYFASGEDKYKTTCRLKLGDSNASITRPTTAWIDW